MRLLLLQAASLAALLTAATAATAGGATVRPLDCGTLSLGPGPLVHRLAGPGAGCLLGAFRTCRPAVYRTSTACVDTVRSTTFTVVRRTAGCAVAVSTAFRVVPRPARPAAHGTCLGLRRQGTAVVAVRCSGGGLAATVSLTAAA